MIVIACADSSRRTGALLAAQRRLKDVTNQPGASGEEAVNKLQHRSRLQWWCGVLANASTTGAGDGTVI